MSDNGEFWKKVKEISKSVNTPPVQVGWIKSLEPFVVQYQGLELSKENGDTIYINHLMLDSNIELDLMSMEQPQNLNTVTPPPLIKGAIENLDYTSIISGTQKQFLTDLYTWIKSVHQRYILSVGDFVAIQRLGNNTYLILEKVNKIE